MAGQVLLTAPTEQPVTLAEAQLHVRSDEPEEASLLEGLIAAATSHAEAYCRRRFVTQSWRAYLDGFPRGSIVLPHPPLVSVQSVKYLDTAGTLTTMDAADYAVRTTVAPGEVRLAYGETWPSTRDEQDAVRIEFTCGYGAASAVPDAIKRAILVTVGHLYAYREQTEMPQAALFLLGPYRVSRLGG